MSKLLSKYYKQVTQVDTTVNSYPLVKIPDNIYKGESTYKTDLAKSKLDLDGKTPKEYINNQPK